jgi:SGNH domain (fused to AT3 domains)
VRCIETGSGSSIFVWGDFTAAALYSGLRQAQQHHSFRLAQFTATPCAPIIGNQGSVQCTALKHEMSDAIATIRSDVLVLRAMWNEHMDFQGLRGFERP